MYRMSLVRENLIEIVHGLQRENSDLKFCDYFASESAKSEAVHGCSQ